MTTEKRTKTPSILYLLTTLSYLPVVGIFIGIILLFVVNQEKSYNRKMLNTLILVGILSSFVFYFIVSKSFIWGNVVHHTTVVESENKLTKLVDKIEVHKKKFGSFPPALTEMYLQDEIIDPILLIDENFKDSLYYYELTEDGYYLFSKGFDRIEFSADDVFPKIKCETKGSVKLINCRKKKKRRSKKDNE